MSRWRVSFLRTVTTPVSVLRGHSSVSFSFIYVHDFFFFFFFRLTPRAVPLKFILGIYLFIIIFFSFFFLFFFNQLECFISVRDGHHGNS